jgi:uncharacterized protein YdaU (DUF1376 family)
MRSPSFMAVDDIGTLDRALDDVSLEAAGAAFKLMVKTFIRGKAFADDEAAARALHMQARRLCRVKDQFDGFFEFAAELVTKARQRFECRAKSELNSNFSPKNQAKSTPPEQKEDIPMSPQERSHRESPPDVREAPADAPASTSLRSGKRGKRKQRPKPQPAKRRTWPPKTANLPLPDDWMPSPAGIAYALSKGLTDADISRQLDRFANHYRANEAKRANWHFVWCGWIDRIGDYEPRQREHSSGVLAGLRAWGAARESYGARHG